MINEEKNAKIRSKTLPLQNSLSSKGAVDAAKQAQILKIESQIRKMKQLVSMQVQLRKNKQQLQKVNSKLTKFQEDVRSKRKEAINQQLASIERRREQRQHYNQESNAILAKIKMHNKQRRRKMQSLIKEYKQEYDQLYEKKLHQRKRLMKLNLEEIRTHESEYLKVVKDRNSLRVKTENCDYSSRNQSYDEDKAMKSVKNTEYYEDKRKRIMQLVKKRKQYGEQAQKQAVKIKISSEIMRKIQLDKHKETYDKNIDKQQQWRKKSYKPKLDTNFQGDIEQKKSLQIKKIANEQSPAKQKLTRLKNLADGYMLKYENGNQEALDKMCNVSLLRADILLKDS